MKIFIDSTRSRGKTVQLDLPTGLRLIQFTQEHPHRGSRGKYFLMAWRTPADPSEDPLQWTVRQFYRDGGNASIIHKWNNPPSLKNLFKAMCRPTQMHIGVTRDTVYKWGKSLGITGVDALLWKRTRQRYFRLDRISDEELAMLQSACKREADEREIKDLSKRRIHPGTDQHKHRLVIDGVLLENLPRDRRYHAIVKFNAQVNHLQKLRFSTLMVNGKRIAEMSPEEIQEVLVSVDWQMARGAID